MQRQKSKVSAWNAGRLKKKGAKQGTKEGNSEKRKCCPARLCILALASHIHSKPRRFIHFFEVGFRKEDDERLNSSPYLLRAAARTKGLNRLKIFSIHEK